MEDGSRWGIGPPQRTVAPAPPTGDTDRAAGDTDPAAVERDLAGPPTSTEEPDAPRRARHARPRRPRRFPVGVVAMAGAVVAGVVGLLATFGHPPYVFTGDQPLLAMRVVDALGFHAALGPYSRFGWSHPGPALFYTLAPVYDALGRNPRAFFVGSLLLNGGCLVATVAVVRRMAGEWASRWAAAVLCVFVLAIGITAVESFWNPYLVAAPLLLTLVLAAAACAGSWLSLVAMLLTGSYCVQTDVGTAPVVLAVCALGTIGLVVHAARHWRWARRARPGVSHLVTVTVLGALGVAALVAVWLAPLHQQLTGHPGNLSAMLHFFRHPPHDIPGGTRHPLHQGVAAVATTVSSVPLGGDLAARTITSAGGSHLAVLIVSMVVALAAAGVAAWRRRMFLFAMSVTTLLTVPVAVVAATHVAGPLFSYLLAWAEFLTVPGLVAAGSLVADGVARWLAAPGPRPRRRRPVRLVAGITGVLLLVAPAAVLAGQLALRPPTRIDDGDPPVAQLAAFARAHLPAKGGGAPLVVIGSLTRWPLASGLVWQLERDGLRPVVTPQWGFMFTSRDVEKGRPRWEVVVTQPNLVTPPAPGTTAPPQLTLDTGPADPTTVEVERVG